MEGVGGKMLVCTVCVCQCQLLTTCLATARLLAALPGWAVNQVNHAVACTAAASVAITQYSNNIITTRGHHEPRQAAGGGGGDVRGRLHDGPHVQALQVRNGDGNIEKRYCSVCW